MERDVDVLQPAMSVPVVGGQIHRFLRRTGAFDRHGRLGEEGAARFEVLDQLTGVGGEVVAVVRGDAVSAERVDQPLDPVPIELEAGADDQAFVLHDAATIEDDGVVLRFEGRDTRLDPMNAFGNERSHGLGGDLGIEHAAADHGPARLVVVNIGGIDDRDIKAGVPGQQAGGDRNAGGTATDDHDVMLGIGNVGRCLATGW